MISNAYVFKDSKWNLSGITVRRTAYVFLQDAVFKTDYREEDLISYLCYDEIFYADLEDATILNSYDITTATFEVSVVEGYTKDLETYWTKHFYRVNSNIYKNIFEHILFDLYVIQEKILGFYFKKTNYITQINHNLDLYDLIYIDEHGLYQKALANEEQYSVVGLVSKILNNNEFVLTTSGIFDMNYTHTSDSSIIYLSDKNPGMFCFYEDITNEFYAPVGFINKNNQIIISVHDASVGDTMKNYRQNILPMALKYLSQQEKINIINQVMLNSHVRP